MYSWHFIIFQRPGTKLFPSPPRSTSRRVAFSRLLIACEQALIGRWGRAGDSPTLVPRAPQRPTRACSQAGLPITLPSKHAQFVGHPAVTREHGRVSVRSVDNRDLVHEPVGVLVPPAALIVTEDDDQHVAHVHGRYVILIQLPSFKVVMKGPATQRDRVTLSLGAYRKSEETCAICEIHTQTRTQYQAQFIGDKNHWLEISGTAWGAKYQTLTFYADTVPLRGSSVGGENLRDNA